MYKNITLYLYYISHVKISKNFFSIIHQMNNMKLIMKNKNDGARSEVYTGGNLTINSTSLFAIFYAI